VLLRAPERLLRFLADFDEVGMCDGYLKVLVLQKAQKRSIGSAIAPGKVRTLPEAPTGACGPDEPPSYRSSMPRIWSAEVTDAARRSRILDSSCLAK
jgi:hypothetical protein